MRSRAPANINISAFSWMRRFDGWTLFAFAAVSCFLYGYGQQRIFGILMILSALFTLVRRRSAFKRLSPIPLELWLYTGWVVWTGVTGPIVADNLGLFWMGLRVLLQVFVMVWAVYAILVNHRADDVVFLGLLAGAWVQIWFVASGFGSLTAVVHAQKRMLGLTQNPNVLGFLMVWALISALLYWIRPGGMTTLRRALIVACIPAAGYVLVASGSRKSFLAFVIVLYLWLVFGLTIAHGVKKVAVWSVVSVVICATMVSFGPRLVKHTLVGYRFQVFLNKGGGSVTRAAESLDRYRMYVDGLKMFVEHPIFGVGLNNFQVHFYMRQYSHSNYIEPLATTGLPGAVMFLAFFFGPIFRIRRLLKVISDQSIRYRLRVYLVGIVAILVIGVGAPFYTNTPVFLMLTAILVTTSRYQKQIETRLRTARRVPAVHGERRLANRGTTVAGPVFFDLPVRRTER